MNRFEAPAPVAFPLDPKEMVAQAKELQYSDAISYSWAVVTSAAALADKRMLRQRGSTPGLHTDAVAELLIPYAQEGIAPAAAKDFYAYGNGEVYARWSNRHSFDKDRHDTMYFAGSARRQTIAEAEIDEDVKDAFGQALVVQTGEQYISDISLALADLIPSDDFPYRALKYSNQVKDFWGYVINGDNRRPGLLRAAAFHKTIREAWAGSLSSIYGTGADSAAQYMLAVLYLRTSERKSGETEREILTPLIESFNSRSVSTIRQTLSDFSRQRLDMIPPRTLRLLDLDESNLRAEQESREAAARPQVLDPAQIESVVYGTRQIGIPHRYRSDLDPNINTWVDRRVGHIFMRDRQPLALVCTLDKPLTGERFTTSAPHFVFAWLDKIDPASPIVKFSEFPARQIFQETRGRNPKTIEVGEYIPAIEEMAYYLMTSEPLPKGQGNHRYFNDGRGVLVNYLRNRREAEQGE